jgi:hypothetical protein
MFKEIVPYVITATVIICAVIAIKIKKEDILTIDGIFAVVGFGFGMFMTFLNLIYTSKELFLLSPLIAITCLVYLRFRTKILTNGTDFNLDFSSKTLKVINILYWLCISVALLSYHQAPPYYRPPIFFVSISLGAALLGLEILASKFKDNFNVFSMISKILLISLILKASAYFISPYPIGSDPWVHAEYIKYFLQFHHVMVTPDMDVYYCNYPIAHLLACASNLIGNISIKESMFIIGAVLALSTIFVYLIVKKITNNINLALLSMLLLSFADFHIRWSIEVIAMTFGIAVYAIIIYLILKTKEKHQLVYVSFLILFLFIITWTHTISAFIALVSILLLYVGSSLYNQIYRNKTSEITLVSFTLCILFIILLIFHWMDPNYPFFEAITIGLIISLSAEAGFLGGYSLSNITGTYGELANILGFLIYVFFGIIGSLYYLSKKYANKTTVSLIFMVFVLNFIRYSFPIFGMRNIIPSRWPAFIYVSFVLFIGIGLIGLLSMLKSKRQIISIVLIILFVSSFFMTTNSFTDMDSPIYGTEVNRKLVWIESEVTLSQNVNNAYNGEIITDLQTAETNFGCYLKRKIGEIAIYRLTPEGNIDWSYMNNKLVVWRKASLTRYVQVSGHRYPEMLLGNEFKNQLDNNFSCMYDTGSAKAYFGRLR